MIWDKHRILMMDSEVIAKEENALRSAHQHHTTANLLGRMYCHVEARILPSGTQKQQMVDA